MEFDRAALDAFSRFDVDGTGFLTRHQLKCAFLALFGTKPTKNQLEVFMKGHTGEEREPSISWHQFRECVQGLASMQDPNERIRQVFKAFDKEACGFISRSTAHAAFSEAAPTVSWKVVDEVFDELDLDHDGRVSCQDFVTMMRFCLSR
ncbi:hypothetical protein DUNSADRAFT_2895 [Dunaliella salina]|uniref:EF-hand domain-containing protein n=1 Tax=Dunaliella salina TaxID=3046 RepID=A0ABQ7GUY7_DUNSA|nr:hypothetical protein DUNSADRAFT_2895 [Dunaliella salina]|eukprot:KAF5838427.1 hypothetical protein DUNSADRAFT_2895 [Dunaliella salina]